MNRIHFIVGLILAFALLTPSMACLMPGAALTASEMECCRDMGSHCGDFQMPAHSCCKVSAPSGERSLIAKATLHIAPSESAVLDNRTGLSPKPQRSQRGTTWTRISPLLLPLQSIDILRI
jgi:hypothetical protein